MRISLQSQAIGCVTSLVSLGAFISGVYQGLSEAKGGQIDPGFRSIIRYGPIALNGLLGVPLAITVSNDPSTIEDLVSNAPLREREQAEGCAKGCFAIGIPITGVAVTIGLEYLGYFIGKVVGSDAGL